MSRYSEDEAAIRAGTTEAFVRRMTSEGLAGIGHDGSFSDPDIRRLAVLQDMERAGLPLEGVAQLVRSGQLSLGFIDTAGEPVFTPLEDVTFAGLSEATGVPIDVLATIRAALGRPHPRPDERVGSSEMEVVPLVQLQRELGFRDRAIEQALRVYGESLGRIAETEAEWFRSEIIGPMLERGASEDEVGRFAGEVSPRISEVTDRAVSAIYHGQQAHAWLTNIINGIALALQRAGLHTFEQSVPAMCFLDITGYAQFTSERGDQVAADFVERLRKTVQAPTMSHRGRAVKWLVDGVMFWFPDAVSGVMAALQMVEDAERDELPPAHVGLHSGPIVFQEGDYYGNTVNVAARIGEFARPGEVLVSQDVMDLAEGASSIEFTEVGAVELKGVLEPIVLYAATAV